MALTSRLDAYLCLERQMMALDDAGDPLADVIRDSMEPIWCSLNPEERAYLDSRTIIGAASLAGSRPSVPSRQARPDTAKPHERHSHGETDQPAVAAERHEAGGATPAPTQQPSD